MTGAYLSLHKGEDIRRSHALRDGLPIGKRAWALYVGSCLLGFGINVVMWFLARRWDSFSYYFTVPFHYNFFPCLAGAVGLFYGFSTISIREGAMAKMVRKLGSLSFGVYLFHEHIDLRNRWYEQLKQILNPAGKEGILSFLWELFCCTLLLFAAGILIDWIRSKLFKAAKAVLGKTKLFRKLKELDGCFIQHQEIEQQTNCYR